MQNDSFGGIPVTTDTFGGQVVDDAQPKRKRTLASIAAGVNDLVIETANAAAGGVSAAANFVRPGNAVSGWIDKNIVEAGEASQSDATKAAKQRFRDGVSGADGVLDELGAVGRYVVENPGLAAAQAVGSFAAPGAAVKGGRTLASIAGLNAARGGLAGGAAAGAAMAGGDAAGTAYELASKAGATDEQAVAAGRQASVLPAVIGGVGGVVGAERLVAGAKGFAGNAASRALKTAAVEGAQEGIEEGVTQYEGQRAAMPYDKTIDPTKGVAAAAGMGAVLGGATGGGVSLLTGGPAAEGAPVQQSEQVPALTQQAQSAIEPVAQPVIDPNAGPLSKAASMAGDLGLTPVPAAPTPEEQRAQLEATISRLPEDAQREARLELADADNESLPAGVRALRSARVQELANGAPAAPVELTPEDMERGRVLQGFDARAAELPPVADYAQMIDEMVLPERRAEFQSLLATASDTARPRAERDAAAEVLHATFSPDLLQQARPTPDERLELQGTEPARFGNEIDFEQASSSTSAPDAMAERINQLALDSDLKPGQALQLNQAHALRRRAAEQGITMTVIPHASGRGYDVAPTARLDPAARASMPQDEAAAQLPYDQSASGRMLAGQDGSVRAETRPEALALSNAATAQRQQVDAERLRRTELGLSNITQVTPVGERGGASPPHLTFDNAPAGRMVAGADGVRQEGRAEVVNRANAPAPTSQTVTSASGAPFATRQAAQLELQRQQLASTHEVAPAGGDESLGFVLRRRSAVQESPARGVNNASNATEPVAERAPNWRTNAMQANRIARGLGIETTGKRLVQVVAEIDAADVRSRMSNQGAATSAPSTTVSAPEFVAAGAERTSAVGVSTISGGGGLQQDAAPRSGPRQELQPNQVPAQEQQAQAAIETGADVAAAGPRAAAGGSTAQQQRDAAPGSEELTPGMVGANTGREVDPSQGDLLSGVAEDPGSGYSPSNGSVQEPTQPDDGFGPTQGNRRAAGDGLVRGSGRASVPRRTASLVGLGIAERIERAGSQALIGERVDSPQRLAELAQVYRDPRYETFRVFFLKGNEVVHATGVSSRMPGTSPMVPAGMSEQQYLSEFRDTMQRTGADGYYVLHNHPSGNPTPSSEDVDLTRFLAARVPGLQAHVVINSNKYAVIDTKTQGREPADMVRYHDFGEDLLLKASKPSAVLGAQLRSSEDLATVGKSFQRPGWITIVGTSSNGNAVRAIGEAPSTILSRSYPYLAATVRRFMRLSGSREVYLVGEGGDMNSAPVRRGVEAGILADAVTDLGKSVLADGAPADRPGFKTPGRTVAAAPSPAAAPPAAPDAAPRAVAEPVSAYAARVGEALKSVTVTDLKKQAGFKAADYRGLALRTLGRRQLVDIYGGMLPEMRRYSDLMARMDADKNEAGSGADQLAQDWAKLPDERALAELMHDSTLAQIDPSRDFVEGDNKTDWTRLQARYNALTPGAKDVYARARDTYRQHMRDVRSAIKERIERTEISSERKAAMLKRMDDEFFGHIKGVYFPLARFGQYVVVVKDAEGKVANVSRAETMAEADASRGQLQRAFPSSKGYTVGKVLKAKDFVAERDSVGRGFMEQLYGVLDKQGMDSKARAELEDALGQLYLSSLPDLSWAKHGIHRKGTPGFSQDARRAFAQNVFHGASYLAKLRYGDRLQDELADMQRRVDAGSTDSSFDSVKAQQVVDEMVKRHEAAMNPKSNALSTALTSLGFIFHLGLSPASAMVNLTQTALVAYPVMGAKWGFKKASAALLKASGEAARGKNDITGSLSPEEKAAFDEAVRAGVVDVTMAHDLAGIAQGEDQKVSWKLRPVMRAASWTFHHAEKFNRQVTFVAAYRLAKQAGAGDKAAYEQAVQATYDGHFDYSANNRPRVMQGNVARVLLLFKQYGQNMVYTLARNAYQSLKGATPEQRSQARKALGGLLTMHGLAAGALGLPMVTTLLAAASMLGGDDDEPWDAQVALQNMLADTFGQKPAEVLAHGLSRLTPWDISGRVGLDKLIFPDVQEGLEGQRLGEAAMSAALGPVAGIGINTLKGMQLMVEGHYLRGLESMAPTVLRGPLKSWRYGTEGVRDKSGIVVQDEVDAASLIGQASGFSPSSVRNAYEGKSAIVQHDRALQARRSALVEQFAMAAMAGDEEGKAEAREAIAKFNEKNPNRRIQAMQLAQSVNMRQKRIREAEEGVYLPSKRREAMEAGRFAVPD